MIQSLKQFLEIGRSKLDTPLIYTILILSVVGLGILFSASSVISIREYGEPTFYLKKQLYWYLISYFFFIVFLLIPYRLYQRFSLPILIISIILLILVFIPGIGKSVVTHYGRNFHRWINLGFMQFQPSEFAKVAIVIYISSYLTRWNHEGTEDYKTLLVPGALILFIIVLVVVEPAFGTSIELALIVLGLIFLNGFPLKNLLIGTASLSPLIILLILKVGYRKDRIDIWLNPYKYRFEAGHQLVSSFRSFLEGHWFGKPLSSGYAHRYLAYSHTDFVLPTFVEDFGFIGFVFIFALFLFLIYRGFQLISHVKDFFGFLLGNGIIIMITLQILMNTFVVTGIVPITGISLPFISYGGSSLLIVMVSLGIFLNITSKENLI
ncbi:MAG: FtsW/RodA/SpoVE family cell cycle protein [Leptospiraceae bacterium]|nr:FtsW/RodA/SpoVE family cell cycle protein [Leptospiraceae bacterium]